MTIRPLTALDAAAFRELRLQATSDSPTAVGPTHDEEARRTIEDTEARIRRTDTQVILGAFVDETLAGIAALRREPFAQLRHKATIWGVFVTPGQRRTGLARQLLTHAIDLARLEGALQVHLCVNAENVRARNLYASLGFTTYGVEPRAMRVGGRYYDEEHMVLRLDA